MKFCENCSSFHFGPGHWWPDTVTGKVLQNLFVHPTDRSWNGIIREDRRKLSSRSLLSALHMVCPKHVEPLNITSTLPSSSFFLCYLSFWLKEEVKREVVHSQPSVIFCQSQLGQMFRFAAEILLSWGMCLLLFVPRGGPIALSTNFTAVPLTRCGLSILRTRATLHEATSLV